MSSREGCSICAPLLAWVLIIVVDSAITEWVQYIAFEVASGEEQLKIQSRAEMHGLEVVGPIDQQIFQSIYFFGPNEHKVKIAANT